MIKDDELAELEKLHGRIKHVTYNGTDLVFRKPKRVEVQQHSAKLASDNPTEKAVADEQLAQLLVVRCGDAKGAKAKEAFLALLEDYPYAVRNAAVGGALAKLTGVVQDDEAKSYGSASPGNGGPQASTPTG